MSTDSLLPGACMGNYLVGARLAAGGFGQVYSATQTGPGGFERTVALKVLHPTMQAHPVVVERFFSEARIAALLNHRHIVQVHEFAEWHGLHYLVMEFVDGLPLSRLAPDQGLPPWVVAGIGAQLASALAYAHCFRDPKRKVRGVIHRDIKPSNVLVSEQGELKISDFGLAKLLEADPVSHGLAGTPAYMSPEQLQGRSASPSSDLFALALILYRLGKESSAPHRLPDGSVDRDRLVGLRTLPPELRQIIYELLAPTEHDRPSTAKCEEHLTRCAHALTPAGANLVSELARRVQSAPRRTPSDTLPTATGAAPARAADFAPQLQTTSSGESQSPTVARTHTRPRARRTMLIVAGVLATLGIAGIIGFGSGFGSGSDLSPTEPDGRVTRVALRQKQAAPDTPDLATDLALPDAGQSRPERPAKRTSGRRALVKRGAGWLTVNARPWATVYVDGRRIGVTPIYRKKVRAGRHTIKLRTARGRQVIRRVVIKRSSEQNLGLIPIR